jgi:hypothetical protein
LEVEVGLGDEAGSVPHPFESGLHQRGELFELWLVKLASDPFRCDHTPSTGLNSGARGGSR